MRPWRTIGEAGGLKLLERDGEYLISTQGKVLMGSRSHGSEEAMATAGLAQVRSSSPVVLVGGLGFGYTLRAALDALGPQATVCVAERSAEVVEWNRGPLAALAGAPLSDSRVTVWALDVREVLARRGPFDVILLDVDNGPFALEPGNEGLYSQAGVAAMRRAVRSGGALVVWSAGPDERFAARLSQAGFEVKSVSVKRGSQARHTLFVGRAK